MAWVEAENKVTNAYLAKIPFRAKLLKRLKEVADFEKVGTPFNKNGKWYVYKNNGLQNQSVLYQMDELGGQLNEFLDPNKLSDDGTVALQSTSFSKDGKYMAYVICCGGRDGELSHAPHNAPEARLCTSPRSRPRGRSGPGASRLGQGREVVPGVEEELEQRLKFFEDAGKLVEAQRLKGRVEFDLEMLGATGMCKGIENYARYLTGQKPGETPYSLFDYYESKGKDYLVIVDESHVSLPQFRGMFAGDRSRKETLVEYGFRLPSALDNRPLMFDEFINKKAKFLFVSATPNDYELDLSRGAVYEQILRPTGLLDPQIILKDSDNQVEILHDMAKEVIARGERILVTVLTKKMAEELSKYYLELGLKVKYMHSDIDAIERNELIRGLRSGEYDMLIGINLLREGLDLPEVSLIAIMDADKEGFLRSRTSLIQTMGRAARNVNGQVVMFCKKITASMQEAIDITQKRRKFQDEYNRAHGITPHSASRNIEESLKIEDGTEILRKGANLEKMPAAERAKIVKELRKQMLDAAAALEFEKAAALRDEIAKLRKL